MIGTINIFKNLYCVLLLCVLSGCATMSKDECKQADWYLKGVDDAMQGYALERVIDHGKACARIDITPDMRAYRQGHEKGARLYCVTDKGYSEGRRGAVYNGICPQDLEGNFLRAYRDGQELFRIEQNMNRLSAEISNSQSSIEFCYNEIHRLQYDIINQHNNSDERRHKINRINELESDIRRNHIHIDRAARELELYHHDFDFVANQHRNMGYAL